MREESVCLQLICSHHAYVILPLDSNKWKMVKDTHCLAEWQAVSAQYI